MSHSPIRKSPTRKFNEHGGNIDLRQGMGGAQDDYTEKPRPNLYNVIKKIREQKGPMIHRICYVSRIDESVFKGDLEKEFTNWITPIFTTPEDSEIPMAE